MNAPVILTRDSNLDAVLDLIRAAFAEQTGKIDPPSSMNTLSVSDIYKHLETGVIWGIYDAAALIGCLFGTATGDALYLSKLSVLPGARGRGIAGRLIATAEVYAAQHGFTYLDTLARIELTANHTMFARLGYLPNGEGRHPGYTRTTELHFRKPVNTAGQP